VFKIKAGSTFNILFLSQTRVKNIFKRIAFAVERTQLDFYGIDRYFQEIEEALTNSFGETQTSQRTTWKLTPTPT